MRLPARWRRWWHDPSLPVWHSPDYRLPITSLDGQHGLEPRRAELAAWALLDLGAILPRQLQVPERAAYPDLARVHRPELLESLGRPETLARIFAVPAWDVPVDEVMRTVRLAVGGTLAAARSALLRRGPALNLLGGFHHAGPTFAGGLCPLNDIAVALAALRAEGLRGPVAVLDLDAHPPDGTLACLEADEDAWIGSISGVDWGLRGPRLVEHVLPGGEDEAVLLALDELLARMPAEPALCFVVAGGDPLRGDAMGAMAMSLPGLRRRDLRVARALRGRPSVWLPGGGYSAQAWPALAGTGLALALGSDEPVPPSLDPLARRFASLSAALDPRRLGGGELGELSEADLGHLAGPAAGRAPRLLGHYTAEGIEYALHAFGLLAQVGRLGYGGFEVQLDRVALGDRMRLWGRADGQRHLLVEGVYAALELAQPGGEGKARVLFVHWLSLRHPRGAFSPERPQLPGQEVPGLGMAREAGQMLGLMADRLGLRGVAHQPSWFHVAWTGRAAFRFLDPFIQGQFEALCEALAGLPLLQATHAVAQGRVRCEDQPWTWPAAPYVAWRGPPPWPENEAAWARGRACRFRLDAPG